MEGRVVASRRLSQGRLSRLAMVIRTACRLGVNNVAAVAGYRVGIVAGWYRLRLPVRASEPALLFDARPAPSPPESIDPCRVITAADAFLAGRMTWFSRHSFPITSPPDWFLNPFSGGRADDSCHWSRIADFDPAVGDIKAVWEPSRFDWALLLAQAHRLSGDARYLDTLNAWAIDWQARNPPNRGPNWKCGQETAIRMLTVLLAAYLLGQHERPSQALVRFVRRHCERIRPTLGYAIAQDNNHGTSEACGLLVGGAWLAAVSQADKTRGLRWARLGRRVLEGRVRRLVQPDGSFAQHSLNYHRLLVDTLNMAEFWRRELKQEAFTALLRNRARAAVHWLYQMVDPVSGDGPNLGANDGARLFALDVLGYREFRPSIQLGAALYAGRKMYTPGPWDASLAWLGAADLPPNLQPRSPEVFRRGGYVTLHAASGTPPSWGVVRFPRYDTRPSHADALHFDLWVDGVNLLRDDGSYSYARSQGSPELGGGRTHNTVQFDDRDQMPRLGRFLYADWAEADEVGKLVATPGGCSWSGGYTDAYCCRHCRTVAVEGTRWRVTDWVRGKCRHATLRWRLAPGAWSLDAALGRCTGCYADVTVRTDTAISRMALVEDWESRHYLERTLLPVLEVEIALRAEGSQFVTEIQLKDPA